MAKISIIGRGRVATHLERALTAAGHVVSMCGGRERVKPLCSDTDVVILAVKDDAIGALSHELLAELPQGVPVAHTAGSVSVDALCQKHRGVFYPMQTFSLDRDVDFSKIPVFVEASDQSTLALLEGIARSITPRVYLMDGEKRKSLHLAAVFCCNFTNHMYAIASEILSKEGIEFDTMLALIDETAAKVHELSPKMAQTGPAVRWDTNVMDSHLAMLEDDNLAQIYKLLSQSIHDRL